jgi:ribosomal protein L30/L7E
MKKSVFGVSVMIMMFAMIMPVHAATLAQKMSGKILLQVEAKGEAWYVSPTTLERYYLGRPNDAFEVMRGLGLGISEENYVKWNGVAPKNFSGRILLRVKAKGEAYYVNPANLKLYSLGKPGDAFEIMRSLGLGISNSNIAQIKNVVYLVTDTSKSTSTTGSASFKVTSMYHANCGALNCFENEFKSCKSGNSLKMETAMGDFIYNIKGTNNGKCKIEHYYTKFFDVNLIGKKMTCSYDQTKKFYDAMTEANLSIYASAAPLCSGSLVEALK